MFNLITSSLARQTFSLATCIVEKSFWCEFFRIFFSSKVAWFQRNFFKRKCFWLNYFSFYTFCYNNFYWYLKLDTCLDSKVLKIRNTLVIYLFTKLNHLRNSAKSGFLNLNYFGWFSSLSYETNHKQWAGLWPLFISHV